MSWWRSDVNWQNCVINILRLFDIFFSEYCRDIDNIISPKRQLIIGQWRAESRLKEEEEKEVDQGGWEDQEEELSHFFLFLHVIQ